MKARVAILLLVAMLASFGVTGCGEEEPKVDSATETEESVDVIIEEPSEDSEDVIPEVDIELE